MAVIYMIAIFVVSGQPAGARGAVGFSGWFQAVMPEGDKVLHFCAFAALGLLLRLAIPRAVTPGLIGIGYAIIDEWHQSMVPSRAFDVFDILADSGGILLGVVLVKVAGQALLDDSPFRVWLRSGALKASKAKYA
jgi:hypothetical protein